ncbi:hypothetical protein [Streptomyces sp. NPDC014995]|uniref:hypothetical protein n=1 Tax=Streptomyces sp. NPDC014995 TaxID=3364936 RepID=UPI0036FABA84
MTTTLTRASAAEPLWACGCHGWDPGLLARYGLLGTAFLVLGGLTAMILAGWLLAGLVWAVARWWPWWQGDGAVAGGEVRRGGAWEGGDLRQGEASEGGDLREGEAPESFFGGFGRWEEDRPA